MTKRIYGIIEFQTLTAKTFVFHPVGPFRVAKRPFLGPRFLGTLSQVYVHEFKIIQIKKLEVVPSLFP